MTATTGAYNRQLTRSIRVGSDSELSDLQAVNDHLVSQGGGTIEVEQGNYSASTPINIDAAYVGVNFNNAKIDVSGCGAGNFWLTVYQSLAANNVLFYPHLTISDGYLIGDASVNVSQANTAKAGGIRFNSTVSNATIRMQLERMRYENLSKAVSFGNRAPFVKHYNSQFHNCVNGIYQETSPTDFTETNSFTDCVFANNDTHFQLDGGGHWTLNNTSLDYHYVRAADLLQGARLLAYGKSHFECDYGQTAGQTNCPFRLQNASSALIWRGGAWAYTGSGQNPYFPAFVEVSNGSHLVDLEIETCQKLGRLSNTTAMDIMVTSTVSSIAPNVRLKLNSQNTLVSDLPSMSQYVDVTAGYGIGGMLRNGVDDPYNELAHRIGLTGTAAIASVNATDNGVTQKNGQKMLKITGAGKVLISFPVIDRDRRHAWSFFYATSTSTSVFSGSVTIKERQTGFAQKFDGTTVTSTVDTRGAVYSGTTVTVNSASATWKWQSWKECNTTPWPSFRQNMASIILIEIDTTNMSAGAFYLTHMAFDLI